MTRRSGRPTQRPTQRQAASPAGAGALLIGTIIACAVVGLGLGALVGAPAALALAGGFVGVGLGMWVVYDRYRDL